MTVHTPIVRTAQPSDEAEVMEMCKLLHSENGLMPMSEDKVRSVLQLAFQRKGGILGVIGDSGKIEAMIFMLLSQLWCSDEWHLEELFNYVRPEYRRSNNARVMLQFAKRCADELDKPLIIGVLSNTSTERKLKLYARQFSTAKGAFFAYNCKWDKATVN